MTRRVLFMLVASLMLAVIFPVSAATNDTATFTIGCDGFSGTGGTITLNRDNTGQSREAFVVSATDGIGNIIYTPVVDSFFVGGTVSWTGGQTYDWTSEPQYNPISLRVVSLAGNNFSEQTVILATGSCAGLPTFGVLPVADDGLTSQSVDINAVPPRPTNPDDITEVLPGFLVVNTDNLSLRSGDAQAYTLVGIVDGGTVLIPLGRNIDFSWWLVQAGDIIGWARADFLIARGDLSDVPVVESEGEIQEARLFVFAEATLRSAPDDKALPLCVIPGDLEYVIVGRNPRITWYEIQATCDNAVVRGWVPSDLGAYRAPDSTLVPVTSP